MYRNCLIIISTIFLSVACSGEYAGTEEEPISIQTEQELEVYLAKAKEQPDNSAVNMAIWRYYSMMGYPAELLRHIIPVYERAERTGNTPLMLTAGAYAGQAYCNLDQYDSMFYYFDRIIGPAKKEGMRFPQMVVYNNLSTYEIKHNLDHNKALEYSYSALDLAQEEGNERNYGIILCNIADIYHYRNDPAGLEHALKAYEIARNREDPYVLLYATMQAAQLYCLTEEYENALTYIEKAMGELNTAHGEHYKVMLYSIYANILSMLDRSAEAEEYYKMILEGFEETGITYAIMSFLGYGNLLLEHGRCDEAINVLTRGADLARERANYETLPKFYMGLSEAYQSADPETEAFRYYKKAVFMRDSIFSIENEREFSRLTVQYEKSRHEQEMQEKELSHMKQKRKTNAVITVLFVLLFVLGGVAVIARKKNRMYRKLVEQHQAFVRQIKRKQDNDAAGDPKAGSLTEQKGNEIYQRIERLLREEHVYRQNDMSLALLSELLATNQSYVSRIINEFAGMSFSNYINSYRIDEAVSILSDTNDNTPLKALSDYLGFNSLSSFYRSFQKETGVPPSKYRSEVRKMSGRS